MRTFVLLIGSILVACGSPSQGQSDAGDASYGHKSFDAAPDVVAIDAAPPVDCDAGMTPSSTYPGSHPAMPQAVSLGGPTMAHPRFVPIVFAAEDRTADIGAFTTALAASSEWATIASQYGVGVATATSPIIVNETPPAQITDADIATWLQGKLDGTHVDFGAPDTSAIYVIYYPTATTILANFGVSCTAFGGYHAQTKVGTTPIVYSVIAGCAGMAMSPITSHELFEAATDPYIGSAPAYLLVDDPYETAGGVGSEIGDLCENAGAPVTPSDIGYPIQRIWSNAASAAGEDPCLPATDTPYFRTAGPVHLVLAPGATTTIDLVAFSDRDTGGPWTIHLTNGYGAITDKLDLALCRTTAQNGERIPLTITRPDSAVNEGTIRIDSTLGSVTTTWTITVGSD